MKSFSLLTMKLNPSFISRSSRISSRSDFICEADLFHRKTDLVEKTANLASRLTVFSGTYGQF